MTAIDLTLPIAPGMPVYADDPVVTFEPWPLEDGEGFVVHEVRFGTHTGTHIDTPAHLTGGITGTGDAAILGATVGDAVLVKVDVASGAEITPGHLGAALDQIGPGDRIIIATGWSSRFGEPDYFTAHPSISPELVDMLVQRDIRLLGIDTPSLHLTRDHELHERLLGSGIVIVESLANLDRITIGRFLFSAAPLPFSGLDGSPVRAIAIVDAMA